MTEEELCPCGQPLHYSNPDSERYVRTMVERFGPTLNVQTPWGAWAVPRHYIALHGLKASDGPELAERYGWERVEGDSVGHGG